MRPEEVAWVASVPCAVVVVAIIFLLGPSAGRVLFPPLHVGIWPSLSYLRPEPTEQARYLLALLAPFLLSFAVIAAARRELLLAPKVIAIAVRTSQALALLALLICIAVQRTLTFGALYYGEAPSPRHVVYFKIPTLVVTALFVGFATYALGEQRIRRRLIDRIRETRSRTIACATVAASFTAIWLMTALSTDASIVNTHYATSGFVLWTMEETFAVVNGRTPLVNYHALYGSLVPYAAAGAMRLFGNTLIVWTTFMASLTCVTLLAVYDVFRRVTRSSVAGLLAYAPFVATGFFMFIGPLDNRYAPSNLFSMFPIRYAGAYTLAWLTARHLDGAWPRRLWPVFVVGGIVVLNNTDFGAPSVVAVGAALLWSGRLGSWSAVRRASLEAAVGLAGAFALVAAISLARAGELPHLSFVLGYAKIFVRTGLAELPMPTLGFHTVMFLTYVAAIVLATVRAAGRHPDRLLTGMLVWSGLFGLGAAGRYIGESHPEGLITEFSPWALSVSLLTIATVREIAARSSHRPTFAELAVLAVFGLSICSVAQFPTPWSQISRLHDTTPADEPHQDYERQFWGTPSPSEAFVASHTHRGEQVLILLPLGFRTAENLGLKSPSPFSNLEAIVTTEEFDEAIAELRAAHGTKVFMLPYWRDHLDELRRVGFVPKHHDPHGFVEWVDGRTSARRSS